MARPPSKQSKRAVKAPVKRQRSEARLQKTAATRLRIIESAGRMIGKYGYAGCSIARVTAETGIAHGTFYLYFKSQQALFDEVLPVLAEQMEVAIREAIRGSSDELDLERRGFTANFDYLSKHPYMYRVLTEAELYAPRAYRDLHASQIRSYASSLRRSLQKSQLHADFSENELETLAAMLIGARYYMLNQYGVEDNQIKPLPKGKLETYLKFVTHGLAAAPSGKPAAAGKPRASRRAG